MPDIAVIYARYSSANQRDVSIEQQVNACRKYAADQNLDVIHVYEDHAMTGTNDNRPEFQQMIKDSATRAFQYVIVYTLDRFSRNKYDSAIHKHTLKENGVKVLSAMEHITDDPTGVLMESILEGFAEYYSKELAQKIRRGVMSNAEKCIVIGPPPLGYRRGDDGKYEIIPEEAKIVQEIYQRVAKGEAFVSIFEDLNQRGVRTKKGNDWNKSSFNKLLHCEKYIGIYEYSTVRIEGGIPAIIDNELFKRVQDRCQTKPRARGNPQKRRRENHSYLLTGKLYCGDCGNPMVGVSGTARNGTPKYYYVCQGHRKKLGCDHMPVPQDWVEELVATRIKALITDPDVIEWLASSVMEYIQTHQETEETISLQQRIDELEAKIQNTLTAIQNGVTSMRVQGMLNDLEAEQDGLKAKLTIARERVRPKYGKEHVIAYVLSFADGDITDKAFQEAMIDAFLVRAYLYSDRLKIILNYTGHNTSEIEIPFGAEDIPEPTENPCDFANASDAEPVRISSSDLHVSHLIRTAQVYIMSGLIVLVTKLHADHG